MPFWQRAATVFAFALITAIIAFAGPRHEAAPVSSSSDIQAAVLQK
jgi:hypothetical protein